MLSVQVQSTVASVAQMHKNAWLQGEFCSEVVGLVQVETR